MHKSTTPCQTLKRAFMLEAAFLGIMLFGWERVNPIIHYLSTILVAVGANLSTLWILTANSWMQTPAGGELVNGKFIVHDYFQAIVNPFMKNSVLHMFFATLETSLFPLWCFTTFKNNSSQNRCCLLFTILRSCT